MQENVADLHLSVVLVSSAYVSLTYEHSSIFGMDRCKTNV